MSSPNSPTLIIDVRARQRELAVALLALASGALVPLLLADADRPVLGAVILVCVLTAGAGLKRAGWIGAGRRIVGLAWLSDGRWLLTDERGRTTESLLCPDTRVGKRCVWLSLTTPTGRPRSRRSILLAAEDLAESDLRRLIVRLRIEGAALAATASGTSSR